MVNDISELLPDRPSDENFDEAALLKQLVEAEEKRLQRRLNIAEINRLKQNELRASKYAAVYEGHPSPKEFLKADAEARAKIRREAVEKAKASTPVLFVEKGAGSPPSTTKPQVAKLLNSLNIDMNVSLTKGDTYNLLATLLTANEKQLNMLLANPKIPVVIKTVITRILADSKVGNMAIIERLWDRIFGVTKNDASQGNPGFSQMDGILPNTIMSREAYVLIHETIVGNG